MGFLVTKDGICLLASRSVLAVLKNYRKEWYVTLREQVYDTLNTEVSEFVQLGIPEWGKFPLLEAYIELSLLDFLFPLCKYTKKIQEQGWSVPLITKLQGPEKSQPCHPHPATCTIQTVVFCFKNLRVSLCTEHSVCWGVTPVRLRKILSLSFPLSVFPYISNNYMLWFQQDTFRFEFGVWPKSTFCITFLKG